MATALVTSDSRVKYNQTSHPSGHGDDHQNGAPIVHLNDISRIFDLMLLVLAMFLFRVSRRKNPVR